jgi:hypothetical protein
MIDKIVRSTELGRKGTNKNNTLSPKSTYIRNIKR